MDNQAIAPTADDIVPQLDDSEVVEKQAIDEAHENEKELASLSSTRGWKRIADSMQADIDGLRTGSALQIDDKTPLEIVGQRFVIAASVAAKLESYLDMVNQAAKAVADYERRKQSKDSA